MISVNGAAAHKANPGDILIIATYAIYNEIELQKYHLQLVMWTSTTASLPSATRYPFRLPDLPQIVH